MQAALLGDLSAVGYRQWVSESTTATPEHEGDVAGAGHAGGESAGAGEHRFEVRLDAFTGPFDLLLSLIAKHRLEVTELALAQVTDDFVAHLRAQGDSWDLDETTEFLVVAAILLDLKAARLLPGETAEDEEDLALLEARDLLFARLLQYRAFKEASVLFGTLLYAAPPRLPREVGLDPGLESLLPEVTIPLTAERFAAVAVKALTPKLPDEVSVAHVHAPAVSVREQATIVVAALRHSGQLPFRALVADAPDVPHVVARFLALLELYREAAVAFEQAAPLGDLLVRWTGSEDGDVDVADEFDEGDPTLQIPADVQGEAPGEAAT